MANKRMANQMEWVILRRMLLLQIESVGNLRMFNRTDQLEDFMRTFQAGCTMVTDYISLSY